MSNSKEVSEVLRELAVSAEAVKIKAVKLKTLETEIVALQDVYYSIEEEYQAELQDLRSRARQADCESMRLILQGVESSEG